jgi:hypothetical protein
MDRNKPMQDFNSLDFDIVAAGISRLRELSDPSAIPILANLLTSQDEDIKSIAIEALVDIAEIGDRIAGEALLTILSDPSSEEEDYFSILNAIQDLVSREIPASLHKNREYIIEALKQFGNKNRFNAHQINLIIDKIGELKTPAVKLKIPE